MADPKNPADRATVRELRAGLALGAQRGARWLRRRGQVGAALADIIDAAVVQTAEEIAAEEAAERRARGPGQTITINIGGDVFGGRAAQDALAAARPRRPLRAL